MAKFDVEKGFMDLESVPPRRHTPCYRVVVSQLTPREHETLWPAAEELFNDEIGHGKVVAGSNAHDQISFHIREAELAKRCFKVVADRLSQADCIEPGEQADAAALQQRHAELHRQAKVATKKLASVDLLSDLRPAWAAR